MTSRYLTACLGLLLLSAGPAAAKDGTLRQTPLGVGKSTGALQLVQRPDGSGVLVADGPSGLRVWRTSDGRRFRSPVRIARPGELQDLDVSLGRRGRVLVAWTVDDGSIEADPENRDDSSCCTRPWVGGTTAAGKAIRPRRLRTRGAVNTGSLGTAIVRGRGVVTAAHATDTDYDGEARVWTQRARGWSGPRRFAGDAFVDQVLVVRLGGRPMLVGTAVGRRRTAVRRWPLAGGRARTLGTLRGDHGFSSVAQRGGGAVGILARFSILARSRFSAYRLTARTLRTTPLGKGLLHSATAGDGRGRSVLAGVESPRSPVVTRTVGPNGRPGPWRRLGRFGLLAEEYDFVMDATLTRRGTVAVWGTASTPVGRHPLVRLQRTRTGRVTRSRATLPGRASLLFSYADRRGRSVALVQRGSRLLLVG